MQGSAIMVNVGIGLKSIVVILTFSLIGAAFVPFTSGGNTPPSLNKAADVGIQGQLRVSSKLPPQEEWNKTYGGERDEFAYEVQQTTDGGYVIGGWTKSFGIAKWNPWLIKTDGNGTEVWNRTYTYFSLPDISGFLQSVQQTNDGGYILGCTFFNAPKEKTLGGSSRELISSLVLIKTDSHGNELWNRTYTGLEYSSCFCVRQTNDGGFIATGGGNASSELPTNLFLLKTTSDGTMQWLRSYGTSDMYEEGHAVQQTSDGGYIVTGMSDCNYVTDWGKIWLIKTDANGMISWSKKFEGARIKASASYGNSVQQTTDHGYVIAGILATQGCLLKTDASGNELWRRTPFLDEGRMFYYSGKQTSDGGYIATGMGLVKTDAQGYEEWNVTMPQPFICGQQTIDGGYVIVGSTSGYYGGDIWLLKFGPAPQVTYTMKGGHGVSLKITNTGTVDANGVAWQVHVSGGILHRINKTMNGNVDVPTDQSKDVQTASFLGLGAITVTATVNGQTTTKTGFQFLTYSIIK